MTSYGTSAGEAYCKSRVGPGLLAVPHQAVDDKTRAEPKGDTRLCTKSPNLHADGSAMYVV